MLNRTSYSGEEEREEEGEGEEQKDEEEEKAQEEGALAGTITAAIRPPRERNGVALGMPSRPRDVAKPG
jgi:hypothetical protein